jgi:hypothetical protein
MNKTKYLGQKKAANFERKVTESFKAERIATQKVNAKAFEKHKKESDYYKYNELNNPSNPYYVGKGKRWYEGKKSEEVDNWDVNKHGKPKYTPVEIKEMGGTSMNDLIAKNKEAERIKREERTILEKLRDFLFE